MRQIIIFLSKCDIDIDDDMKIFECNMQGCSSLITDSTRGNDYGGHSRQFILPVGIPTNQQKDAARSS